MKGSSPSPIGACICGRIWGSGGTRKPACRCPSPGTRCAASCIFLAMADFVGPVAVLVVDDEEPIRNALKKFMAQQQFEVYAAASGDEALAQLKRHKIALMLCDIRMPGTSGVDLVPHAL